jgi:hypothetical protein
VANPYEIAIHMSMTNGVSPILALISKDMLGLQLSVKKLEDAFGSMGSKMKLAIGGAVAIAGGVEGVKVVLDLAKSGEKLIHQQSVLQRNGVSYLDTLKLTADAYDRITKAVPTASGSDVLKAYNEMRDVYGAARALAETPLALKVEALTNNIVPGAGEGSGFLLFQALAAKGMTGADNTQAAETLVSAMLADISASAGKLTPATYRAMARRGGSTWMNASPEFIAGPWSVVAGELGGDTAGTAMATLRNFLTGATQMSKQQFLALQGAGLINPGMASIDSHGRVVAQPGAIKGSLEHGDNFFEWEQSVLPQLHAEARAMKGPGTEAQKFEALLATIGRNRNSIRILDMFSNPGFLELIQKDLANFAAASGTGGYNAMLGLPPSAQSQLQQSAGWSPDEDAKRRADALKTADYTAVMAAFEAQWRSMTEAVGSQATKAMIPILQQLTTAFNAMGAFANAHGTAVAAITQGAIALSAALAALGVTALVIAGGVPGAIIALATAMGALAVINWGAISNGFNVLVDAIGRLFAMIEAIPGKFGFTGASILPSSWGDSVYAAKSLAHAGYARGDLEREAGRESSRGLALGAMSAPVVVNQTANLIVDGRVLASVVAKYIVQGSRVTDSSSGHDGQAAHAGTDTAWDR